MFYIAKQEATPTAFAEAVSGFTNYGDLPAENKKAITELLAKEQGHLCALCEREIAGTIEHFLPKSVFPRLQLDYHNLYMACGGCNTPKGDNLIPAYLFDPRFDPCKKENLWKATDKIKVVYTLENGKCRVDAKCTQANAAQLIRSTLELTAQNRGDETNITHSLVHQRGAAYSVFTQQIVPKLSKDQLIQKWQRIESLREAPEYRYEEFISLKVFLLAQAMKNRGITRNDL